MAPVVLSDNLESCTCGALGRLFQGPEEKSIWSPRLLPGPLNVELGRSLVFAIEGFEVGGGGCLNDSGKASFQEASHNCILHRRLDARFAC